VGAIPQYRPDREIDAKKVTPEKLKANLEAGGILKEQFVQHHDGVCCEELDLGSRIPNCWL
jgi:hypothetical protein